MRVKSPPAARKTKPRKEFRGFPFQRPPFECGQDYGPETIARLAPWIRNVYLQNQVLKPDGAITLDTWCHGPISFDIIPIHEPGGIDFARLFAGLKNNGDDGPVTVHQSAPDAGSETTQEAATRTAEFLRSL